MALSDEKREEIKALLATGISKNDVAKRCKVSWSTVDGISKQNPDEIENFREQKRVSFIDKLWMNMEDAIDLGHQRIKMAKESSDKAEELIEDMLDKGDVDAQKILELSVLLEKVNSIPLSHLSTYFGTLYDKQALMNGDPTSNVSGGVVIQIGIPDKAE